MIKTYNLGALFDPELGADNLAIIDCLDWDAPREYSHRQIDEMVNSVARGLQQRDLRVGDAVAILSANRTEFLVTYLAVLRAGMIAVPINYKFPQNLVDHIFEDSAVKYVFCDGARRANLTTDLPVTNFDATGDDGFGSLLDPGERFTNAERRVLAEAGNGARFTDPGNGPVPR